MSTNNFSHGYEQANTISSDQQQMLINVTDNQQQPNVVYIRQPGISNNIPSQQPMSNVASNSSDNNHSAPNSTLHGNNQSTSNNESSPQFRHDQNQHNPPQPNILPLLNPFGININYPQAPIIINMPATNSDIQTQLLAYLNNFSSTKTQ
ncbi:hypothetical protein RclHR1_02890008 [Rhizophagus clarus]|uniref:Uncharacterized protein n=1 Tax=Rhizophagus clarus TaxID=94130 RepID=A0A2Z6RJR9_9GLOM|nr:hypothetical protein RclHR1_02890008 [Rhizophagus clarus]GES98043.1 hypothetical protein GLOIN_2v1880782 [Rhizophagus clarus]